MGRVARIAEDSKYSKHWLACHDARYGFLGFAADCFRCLTPDTAKMLTRLAHILESIKSYPPYLASNIVHRRISFAIQLGVARQLVARRQIDVFF